MNLEMLETEAVEVICSAFNVDEQSVKNVSSLKKGMTNRSYSFSVNDKKYIIRIPGEGTDALINRKQEAEVYSIIAGRSLCDEPVYINAETGYKITEYLENIRCANPEDIGDLKRCMEKLKYFHGLELQVGHEFDIFGQIDYYESLWGGENSVYQDYPEVKEKVFSLKSYIENHTDKKILTHIDAVPDNFLFAPDSHGKEALQLTDWEYAGMQDPHVDIAMFCIYSMYNKSDTDRLIDLYFDNSCSEAVRKKIYCYIASCGLLWSNWCEFKIKKGVDFGEYALRQYQYASEYFEFVKS